MLAEAGCKEGGVVVGEMKVVVREMAELGGGLGEEREERGGFRV